MKQNEAKILVIEDEAAILKIFSYKLTSVGFNVITAANGKDGLDMAISQTPDIILLDILMPVMDGLTMLQNLRKANDYGKKVPVIFVTNLSASDEEIIKKVADTEPIYYFVKIDMKMDDLISTIKKQLKIN